ncbi:hypothetical protein B296_00008634 [Ensete ventricosum]|uniref:Uncharacterized protein n=1 Tax=Ensete ventricosum TaxID=4639 RepID=A0A427A8D5_ENSVE|nr:hypothetical protein B296_00008634 [Ensete ventricosum]
MIMEHVPLAVSPCVICVVATRPLFTSPPHLGSPRCRVHLFHGHSSSNLPCRRKKPRLKEKKDREQCRCTLNVALLLRLCRPWLHERGHSMPSSVSVTLLSSPEATKIRTEPNSRARI